MFPAYTPDRAGLAWASSGGNNGASTRDPSLPMNLQALTLLSRVWCWQGWQGLLLPSVTEDSQPPFTVTALPLQGAEGPSPHGGGIGGIGQTMLPCSRGPEPLLGTGHSDGQGLLLTPEKFTPVAWDTPTPRTREDDRLEEGPQETEPRCRDTTPALGRAFQGDSACTWVSQTLQFRPEIRIPLSDSSQHHGSSGGPVKPS